MKPINAFLQVCNISGQKNKSDQNVVSRIKLEYRISYVQPCWSEDGEWRVSAKYNSPSFLQAHRLSLKEQAHLNSSKISLRVDRIKIPPVYFNSLHNSLGF